MTYNNTPIVFMPQYFINPQANQIIMPISTWNYLYKEYATYAQIMAKIGKQSDITQRREFISQYIPQELVFFGNKQFDLFGTPLDSEFSKVANYMVNDTYIDKECAELFMCTHILAAAWGRITIENGDHREAPVIYALGFANSGQRKSAVNDRLCAPIMEFEGELRTNHQSRSGHFSKTVLHSLLRFHANKILEKVDFDYPETIFTAVEEAKMLDDLYKDLQEQIRMTPRINVTHITPYGLAKTMQENGDAQLLASAEAGGLEDLLFHKNTELALKSYGQEPYIYTSAKGHIELTHPTLNIAVLAQFIVASKFFTSSALCNRGTIPRIMPYINLLKQPITCNHLTGDEAEIYFAKLIKLYRLFYTRDSNAERYSLGVDQMGSRLIRNFRMELDAWTYELPTFRSWVAKLHGQALRLALAIHLWRNPDNPCESPITGDEVDQGIQIARNTVNSAYFLYSPYGLTACRDAIKIIHSLQRINSPSQQVYFLQYGTDTTKIQQRTGIDRINVNNALQLMSWKGFVALFDDGSGKLQVLPHRNFFGIQVTEV